jgi:hypothetical protein
MPTELHVGGDLEKPKIETGAETLNERPDFNLEKQEIKNEKAAEVLSQTPAVPIAPIPVIRPATPFEAREKQIEIFLAKDLEEIYLALPLNKQVEFRKTGEETARKINKILEHTKINLGKIVNLIRKWLSLIPGVNKFFLEQEAKIKADEIVKLKKN